MEGDWITLALFLFFFVVLPLLQQIGKRRSPPEPDAEPEAEWEQEPAAPSRRRIEPEEWVTWEEPEREPVAERSAWEELGLEDLFREEERRPQPAPPVEPAPRPLPAPEPRPLPPTEPRWEPRVEVPAPVRVPRPAPLPAVPEARSREALQIDREAEHRKLHARLASVTEAVQPRVSRGDVAAKLFDAREIRRAVLVAEVLGPPRALREHEPRG